jgi:hypothetical protein
VSHRRGRNSDADLSTPRMRLASIFREAPRPLGPGALRMPGDAGCCEEPALFRRFSEVLVVGAPAGGPVMVASPSVSAGSGSTRCSRSSSTAPAHRVSHGSGCCAPGRPRPTTPPSRNSPQICARRSWSVATPVQASRVRLGMSTTSLWSVRSASTAPTRPRRPRGGAPSRPGRMPSTPTDSPVRGPGRRAHLLAAAVGARDRPPRTTTPHP